MKELGWRVVDHRNKVLDAETMKAEELLKEKNKEAAAEKERKDASNERAAHMDLSPERDGNDG